MELEYVIEEDAESLVSHGWDDTGSPWIFDTLEAAERVVSARSGDRHTYRILVREVSPWRPVE
ncbi:hypothetical protein SEA_TRAFT412_2 [Mycobacterium phage Traft412]|nr:hypothetical protein SEA_TRAFT412_2 [Mycobacterium phage Traft412]